MKISFTGIKNPGYYSKKIYTADLYNNDGCRYSSNDYININCINMELTDDYNGKDLSEYKKQLEKSNVKDLEHPLNSNFINIGVLKGELPEDKGTYLFLNGKPIEVEDGNLPIISFMVKKILQLKDNISSASIDKDYYKSDIAANSLDLGNDLRDEYYYYEDPLPDLKKYYTPRFVSETANNMFKLMNNKMMEYFDIPQK